MKTIHYKCQYDSESCNHVDTASGYLDIECEKCERFNHGIRATGATPILGAVCELFRKLFK